MGGRLSRPLRTTVRTPAEMVQRALSTTRAAKTLVTEARDAQPVGSALWRRLDFERQCLRNRERDYARLAADLDRFDFERRRKRAA